jgi:hypothetical protein
LIGPSSDLLDVSKGEGGLSIDADGGLGHNLRGVGGAQVDFFIFISVVAQAELDRFGGLTILTDLTLSDEIVLGLEFNSLSGQESEGGENGHREKCYFHYDRCEVAAWAW